MHFMWSSKYRKFSVCGLDCAHVSFKMSLWEKRVREGGLVEVNGMRL